MAIPFIILEDLQEMFDNLIMDNFDKSVVDFATYIESIYSWTTSA